MIGLSDLISRRLSNYPVRRAFSNYTAGGGGAFQIMAGGDGTDSMCSKGAINIDCCCCIFIILPISSNIHFPRRESLPSTGIEHG